MHRYRRRDQPAEANDFKEVYSSCRYLLFEVKGVVKDSKGAEIESKPIKSLSELFEMAQAQGSIVNELI